MRYGIYESQNPLRTNGGYFWQNELSEWINDRVRWYVLVLPSTFLVPCHRIFHSRAYFTAKNLTRIEYRTRDE